MSVSTALAPDARPAPDDPGWEAFEIERVTARLVEELAGRVEPVRIRREVERAADELTGATVRHYVPLLVERRVRRLLRDAAPMPDRTTSARSVEGTRPTRAKEAS